MERVLADAGLVKMGHTFWLYNNTIWLRVDGPTLHLYDHRDTHECFDSVDEALAYLNTKNGASQAVVEGAAPAGCDLDGHLLAVGGGDCGGVAEGHGEHAQPVGNLSPKYN